MFYYRQVQRHFGRQIVTSHFMSLHRWYPILKSASGRLGDMYGHKKIYLIGWLWFSVWSLILGFCYKSHHILFSICRAFQGIGTYHWPIFNSPF